MEVENISEMWNRRIHTWRGVIAFLALLTLTANLTRKTLRSEETPWKPVDLWNMKTLIAVVNETEKNESITTGTKDFKVPSFILSKNYSMQGCQCIRSGISIKRMKKNLKYMDEQPDLFTASFLEKHNFDGHSSCSDYATQRGKGQNVISYSYFSPQGKVDTESHNFKKYLRPLYSRAEIIKEKYPGWVMRIYHNVKADDEQGSAFLCKIFCAHQHVDFCHVKNLPPDLGDLEKRVAGRLWRFAVMGDPTVFRFLSRDSDSWILDREVAVVNEWIASNKTFHVIRDHPGHSAVMLAGLWGGVNKNVTWVRSMRDAMFSQLNKNYSFDQIMLRSKVWPNIKNDVMQHDSYHCERKDHKDFHPFPVQRVRGFYCGWGPFKVIPSKVVAKTKCPVNCRPKLHKDWEYC